tara:strand:- start:107 stop:388 length:282 start_codon:yes stop_codon:yes gene_type:complete
VAVVVEPMVVPKFLECLGVLVAVVEVLVLVDQLLEEQELSDKEIMVEQVITTMEHLPLVVAEVVLEVQELIMVLLLLLVQVVMVPRLLLLEHQ